MRFVKLIIWIALFSFPAVAKEYPKVTVFQYGTEGYNIYRIPAIVRAANGDLLTFCEARVGGDASEIDLVMKRSQDQGKSWGLLKVVQMNTAFAELFPKDTPPITIGNPAPVVDLLDPDHPGRIWMPFTLENDRVFVIYSDDHGETWSKRREITEGNKRDSWGWYATGPVHSIQIRRGPHKGRLVIPVDHRLGKDGQDKGPYGVHVVYSDDHGKTWLMGAVDDTYKTDDLNANETTVVELNDGRLYFNTRDNDGKARGNRGHAYSSDGGTTFDTSGDSTYKVFQPCPDVLDPPIVQCAVLRASSTLDGADSDVILFSGPDENGPSGKGRSDLRIRYTTDETKTWQEGPLIHVGPAAYSDMVRIDPDSSRIGIFFESGDPGGKQSRIDFATMDLSDLKSEN